MPREIIIADSSCLIILDKIGELGLLHKVYDSLRKYRTPMQSVYKNCSFNGTFLNGRTTIPLPKN